MNKFVSLKEIYPLIAEQLSKGGSATFIIHGTSMLPLLKDGKDSVTVVSPNKLKRRDIILYTRENGDFILHRIVKVKKDELICRGDNQFENESVLRKNVLCVVSHYPKNGKRKSVKSLSHTLYSIFWLISLFPRRVIEKFCKGKRK